MDCRHNDSQQHNNSPPQLTATQLQSDSQSSTHHSNFTGSQLTKYDTWPTQGYDDEVDEDRRWGMGFQGDDAGVNDSSQQWQMPQHTVLTDSYTGDNYSSPFDCSQHPPPNILPPFDSSQYPSQYMPPNTQQAINYPLHSAAPNTRTTLYSAHPSQYLPPGSQPSFGPLQRPSQNMDPDAQLSFNIPHNGHILSQSTTSPIEIQDIPNQHPHWNPQLARPSHMMPFLGSRILSVTSTIPSISLMSSVSSHEQASTSATSTESDTVLARRLTIPLHQFSGSRKDTLEVSRSKWSSSHLCSPYELDARSAKSQKEALTRSSSMSSMLWIAHSNSIGK